MKKTISIYDFRNEFRNMDRDYYSYDGYEVIYEYLESIDEDFELDVIAICGDFNEYTEDELTNQYGRDNTFKNMNEDLRDRVVGFTEDTVILRAY